MSKCRVSILASSKQLSTVTESLVFARRDLEGGKERLEKCSEKVSLVLRVRKEGLGTRFEKVLQPTCF